MTNQKRKCEITATNLYRLAMDVLNNEEIKEGCKNMEEELKSGITLDEIIDRIEQII